MAPAPPTDSRTEVGTPRPRLVEYDGQFVEIDGDGQRPRQMLAGVLTILAVIAMIACVAMLWVVRQVNPPGEPGEKVGKIVIEQNSSIDQISELLESEGVIASASVFSWYFELHSSKSPQAGEYVDFVRNSSMPDAIAVLDKGPIKKNEVTLTVIPGKWLTDALDQIVKVLPNIKKEDLESALTSGAVKSKYMPADKAADIRNWEGFLYPDTVRIDRDANATKVMQKLVGDFDKKLASFGYDQAESSTGKSAYELITIASLIERETGDPKEERGKIARVIENRLAKPEILGIDAANLYGLGKRSGTLSKEELAVDNPYNLRKRQGLPPTAIGLPGADALKAAIAPPEGDWMYYVLASANPRAHYFTNDYNDFLAKKAEADKLGLI